MPIDVSWLVEGRVTQLRFRGEVTVAELEEGSLKLLELVNDHEGDTALFHNVHDASALTKIPIQLNAINAATRDAFLHPRTGWTVAHNPQNAVQSFIGNMIGRVTQARYRIFDTRAEALAFLNYVDETLPSLLEYVDQTMEP